MSTTPPGAAIKAREIRRVASNPSRPRQRHIHQHNVIVRRRAVALDRGGAGADEIGAVAELG